MEKPEIKPKPKFLKAKEQNYVDKNELNKAIDLLNKSNLNETDDINYDIRIDEDQVESCNKIIDLLFKSGYYKANINGLSEFDKIIGGLVWVIQHCNINVDIDLFYEENLTIGKKISLTEKIVKVLNIMKCPNSLEPHQIQGLDCKKILPVVNWLIIESIEFREHIKDYIDLFAVRKFDLDHGLITENQNDLIITRSKEAKKLIKQFYNINEVKINLELELENILNDIGKLEEENQDIDKQNQSLLDELSLKEKNLFLFEEELKKCKESINLNNEKKELIVELFSLEDELKNLKNDQKVTKKKLKKEFINLMNTEYEVDDDLKENLKIENSKLESLLNDLSEVNKEYLVLRRKYDDILSKEEMNQYQKRFLELSYQVSNKLKETKKFFILYNQLEDTKSQLEKKNVLFDSLINCYEKINSSDKQNIQSFLSQLEQKKSSIENSLKQLKNINKKETQNKVVLEQQHVEIIEMNRLYNRYVKQFNLEMKKFLNNS